MLDESCGRRSIYFFGVMSVRGMFPTVFVSHDRGMLDLQTGEFCRDLVGSRQA
ncbi:MAG: hypothetical protein O3A47_03330 [Chloroflexi bacterium]|nr:hypothetical protein [Chloroflexota bacterium]